MYNNVKRETVQIEPRVYSHFVDGIAVSNEIKMNFEVFS